MSASSSAVMFARLSASEIVEFPSAVASAFSSASALELSTSASASSSDAIISSSN